MNITIQPGKLNGTAAVPPSKSYAHRMLIGAVLAEGECQVEGISDSEDMLATKDCMQALRGDGIFPCRESGSTLRFFIPLALAVRGEGTFTGTQRLIERGIGIYEELFAGCGISVEKTADQIRVQGQLKAGEYQIRGDVSSQFVTGMLFALSVLKEDSLLKVLPPVESRPYIDITIDVMKKFGVIVEEKETNTFVIKGGQKYQAGHYVVEGDWSNGAFLYAFNEVGSELEITGLNPESIQGDKKCLEYFRVLQDREPDVIDLSDTPDLGPVLFATAAALHGGRFTGIRRLRIKESDRVGAMAEELEKFGVTCQISENDMEITSSGLGKPARPLDGHNDHRIVMALSIPASLTGATILGAEAVAKSWPDYFNVLQNAGMDLTMID